MPFWNRKQAFLDAAGDGNLCTVRECIRKGVHTEAKDIAGLTALHIASRNGHLNIVKYLIEKCQVNTEAKTNNGMTALHYASENGCLEIVQYLIEICHVDTEAKTKIGWTTLHWASRNGHLEIVQYLIETRHLDMEVKNKNGQSAYDIAMAYNKSEVTQYLMKVRSITPASVTPQRPLRVDEVPTLKQQPILPTVEEFLEAAENGNLDKLKELIHNGGVDKDATSNDGMTALQVASFFGYLEIVQYLIDTCNVDTEAKTNMGSTALHIASENGHLEVVQYLIATGHVDTEERENHGSTALHIACAYGNLDVVQYLIGTGQVDIEAKNNIGQSVCDIAMTNNKSEVVLYLLEMSEVTAGVNDGKTVSTLRLDNAAPNQINNSTASPFSSADQPQSLISNLGAVDPNPLVLTSVSSMATVPTFKLNEAWMMSLQNENQLFVDTLNRLDSSLQFIDERRDLLELIVVEKCTTLEEQNEQRAILASPNHRDFYLLLQRKLKCMIQSCETLSTGMVSPVGGDMRAFCARTISEHGYNIFKETKVGFFIANAVQWSKNLTCIPFVDTVGSIFRVIVTLKHERDRYMGLASVADFATMACLPHYGATSLDVTIEKVARHFVRARNSSLSCKFVEKKDHFGKLKQLMINLLADSGNTPAKEEASKAADCAFAHIMKPGEDSALYAVLNDSSRDVGLAEALAATILGISVHDLNQLEPFPTSPPTNAIVQANQTSSINAPTANVSNAGFNGSSISTIAPSHSAAYASSEVVSKLAATLQQQKEMTQKQEEMNQKQEELIQQLTRKVARLEKAAVDNDPGSTSGTLYAKPEDVFQNEIAGVKFLKNDVHGLTDEVTTIYSKVAEDNLRILVLEERLQYLERTSLVSDNVPVQRGSGKNRNSNSRKGNN